MLSLELGGNNNKVLVEGKSFTMSQIWHVEDFEIITEQNGYGLYSFNCLSNGLYLKPSNGAFEGFKTNSNKVYLTRQKYPWFIFASQQLNMNSKTMINKLFNDNHDQKKTDWKCQRQIHIVLVMLKMDIIAVLTN